MNHRTSLGLIGLGIFFAVIAVLLDSKTALANLTFMALLCLARNPLRRVVTSLKLPPNLSLVGFGLFLGLAEEALWYFGLLLEGKPQPWVSLADDFIRMGPIYLLLFVGMALLTTRFPLTEKQSFLYGGAMGYIFYFWMEGSAMGFQPLWLLILWEINNFLLNGFLLWLPLYVTGRAVENNPRTWIGHTGLTLLILLMVIVAVALVSGGLALLGYQPIHWGI